MKKIEGVVRDDEYADVFADGMMVEIGDEVTKLIFYQDTRVPSENGVLNPDELAKVLKFEVRIPQSVFERILNHSLASIQAIDRSYDEIEGIKDEKINQMQTDFVNKLQSYLYDSNLDYTNDDTTKTIIDQFYDVVGRCQRERNKQQPQQPKLTE